MSRSRSFIYLNKEHGLGRDLHIVAELEVREEGNRLRHAHVAVHLEADIGDGKTRHYQPNGILSDDIQTSDDADGKGEDEGHAAGEEESPPWELDLMLQGGAEDEGHCHRQRQQRVEPPPWYVIIFLHQLRVDVRLLLPRSSEPASRGDVLPVEEADMRDGGGDGSKAEPIRECKEGTEVDPAELLVRGEDGERLGVVQIEPPVRCGHNHIDEDHEAEEDVEGGEEGRDERAEEEGGDGRPVQREGTEAQALHARAQLLSRHGLGEDPAHP